ncbi:alpha/beta hydrolase [Priestia aryabhattai]|uniref:alpha/beta hydrolase n=1 Tax=Priestia aryabhattai TaxID=412384 RepID=UPI001CCD2F36|nr:alpha/beta hydrolase [Priestia aryabhattai]MBZ6489560.1 alpha/beta hydrolase [Priestia aryabhattai]
MLVEKKKLWESSGEAYYVKYLLDNTPEIDENRKHPAVIICPGGGYMVTSDREAEPIALQFLSAGYNTIVLRYTTQDKGNAEYPTPLFDLAKMVLTVRQNAIDWNIDPDKIAICGFSAGGHLCASLAVHWQDSFLLERVGTVPDMIQPNAVILGYPLLDIVHTKQMLDQDEMANIVIPDFSMTKKEFLVEVNNIVTGEDDSVERIYGVYPINFVNKDVPPVFIWHTAADTLIYVGNSLKFALKLEEYKIPFEMHIFETGDHGLSLGTKVTGNHESFLNEDAAQWLKLALRFLSRHFEI